MPVEQPTKFELVSSIEIFVSDVQAAGSAIKKQIEVLHASTGNDIDTVCASLARKPIDALLVGPSALANNRRVQLVTLAAYHRLLAIYPLREYAEAGGLMSYGTSSHLLLIRALSNALRQLSSAPFLAVSTSAWPVSIPIRL
jgi:hypothetical protein